MVLEKTLESPLDCKEIQPSESDGNFGFVLFCEGLDRLYNGILKVEFSRSSLEVSFTSLMKVVNFYEITNMDVGV